MVWQVLFDEYRNNGGYLDNMDNMLIDLANIERQFTKCHKEWTDGFVFKWWFHRYLTWFHTGEDAYADEDHIVVKFDRLKGTVEFSRVSVANAST